MSRRGRSRLQGAGGGEIRASVLTQEQTVLESALAVAAEAEEEAQSGAPLTAQIQTVLVSSGQACILREELYRVKLMSSHSRECFLALWWDYIAFRV